MAEAPLPPHEEARLEACDDLTALAAQIPRVPMAIISSLDAEQREYAEGVTQSADTLLTIVNDVLDLSKIEAGTLAIEPFEFELKPMIAGALAPVSVKARAKHLVIDVHFGTSLPEWVIGDPLRIRQVLINLVDNAVKFTEQGTIRIEIDGRPVVNRGSQIQFSITDTGVGIPGDKLSSIFDKFTQVDSSTTRTFCGTGLGLAICRQLVDLMHGEIGVTSRQGHGSTFSFTLPLQTAEPFMASLPENAPLPPNTPGPVRALHVLVVEDNRINQTVAVRRIQKAGCTAEVAENGEVAVRRVAEQHFDVVFMDCQMPIMDGYEATRQIRQRPEHATLPIVAMTAMEGDRQRCLDAGMSDYLCKPLQPADLEKILTGLRHAATDPQLPTDVSTTAGVLDETAIRSLFDDDVEAMLELIGLIRVDLPRYAARLATHVEQGEWIEVARLAHTIKGAASNVSGTKVADAAQTVEQASRRGDGDAVVAATAPLLTAVGTLVEALTAWGTRLVANGQANAA